MAKIFIDAMIFGLAAEIVCYLVWSFNIFGGLIQYPLGSAADLNNLSNLFSLNLWTALIGGTGVVIGIASLLLRQGTYALYAMLLFGIGIFFNVIKGFVLAVPNTVEALLLSMGVGTATIGPFETVITVIMVFAGFMYVFGLVIQRDPM